MDILDKYNLIRSKIPANIKIVCATKYADVSLLSRFLDCSQNESLIFGENKAQDFLKKFNYLKPFQWHFIGRLQRNKIKYLVGKVELIQSVDSIEIAQEINKKAKSLNINQKILLQINIAKDQKKAGLFENEISVFLKKLKEFDNIKLLGLMSVMPQLCEEVYYKKMNLLFESIKGDYELQYLSMGMSEDYQKAIAHGSNMIRLGKIIFGN